MLQPYLPDFFQSHHTQSASPIQEPPSSEPRVLTVASAATHEGGGPSHTMWGAATDPHLHEVHGADAAAALSGSYANASAAALTKATDVNEAGSSKQASSGVVSDLLEDLGLKGLTFLPKHQETLQETSANIVKAATSEIGSTTTEVVKDAVQDVREVVSKVITQSTEAIASEEHDSKSPKAEKLKPEEKQGLYALAGIVSAGYLLSKLFV